MFSSSKRKVEGLIEVDSSFPFLLPSPGRDLRLLWQRRATGGRPVPSNASTPRAGPCGRLRRRFATCPPKQSFFGASCALDARDSRHWARRTSVHAALRSLITSPGRPPALRPMHGNVTLWHNVHVSATSVSDAPSLLARDHILKHPSLPNSAQRTKQRREA